MKKLLCFLIIYFVVIMMCFVITPHEVYADALDYYSYAEIMMVNGKLLANFTESDKQEVLSKMNVWPRFFDIEIVFQYQNEPASYRSQTLYSFENSGTTAITHEYDITTERSKKTTFKFTGSISGAGSGTIKKVKAEASAKVGIEYSEVNEESVKDVKKTKFVIDPGTKGIIYLEGNMSVSNGVVRVYYFFNKAFEGFFEIVVIGDQFPRFEVKPI